LFYSGVAVLCLFSPLARLSDFSSSPPISAFRSRLLSVLTQILYKMRHHFPPTNSEYRFVLNLVSPPPISIHGPWLPHRLRTSPSCKHDICWAEKRDLQSGSNLPFRLANSLCLAPIRPDLEDQAVALAKESFLPREARLLASKIFAADMAATAIHSKTSSNLFRQIAGIVPDEMCRGDKRSFGRFDRFSAFWRVLRAVGGRRVWVSTKAWPVASCLPSFSLVMSAEISARSAESLFSGISAVPGSCGSGPPFDS
jgi:hypothetical protein